MELLAWGPTTNVRTLSWFDADRETTHGVLSVLDTLSSSSLVADDGGTYAFVGQTGFEMDDGVLGVVAEADVVFLGPVVFFDDRTATVDVVGESPAVADCYERLDELTDARVARVRGFRRGLSASATLTERQQSALEAAVAVGYYDVPRTGSLERVADELNCAVSTAGELVRKAESKVLAGYADTADTGVCDRRL